MAEQITYYAIVGPRATRDRPSGLARRREDERGPLDEALGRDLNWRPSSVIVEWKRAESTEDLVEISEAEAQSLIQYFRQKG